MENINLNKIHPLTQQLDELLEIAYPNNGKQRQLIIKGYIQHEILDSNTSATIDYNAISKRCLFFACQEVLPHLTRRYLFHPNDHLMHEELNLYIQDRLLAHNYRRIGLYQEDKKTKFKTYIQRIIHNLSIDFMRKQSREAEIIDHNIEIELPENAHLDTRIDFDHSDAISGQESLIWLQELFQGSCADNMGSKQQQIAEHLNLSLSERLFLKAIYFGDLSAEQAGALPGIELNKNQANSLHRRLLERLADVFKQLKLYEELQQLVLESDGLHPVNIGNLKVRVAIRQFILLIKDAQQTQCQVEYANHAVAGQMSQAYTLLRKRFFQHMRDIRNDAMAGEDYMLEVDKKGRSLKLRLLDSYQEIQPRYRKKIKDFFATQFTN